MKNRIVFVAVALFCGWASLYSQTKRGAWELSLSGNAGSVSTSRKSEGPFGRFESKEEAQGFLAITARPGFYIVDGLVLEPEFLWTATEESDPSFSFSGNLAYNFSIPESHVTPFVLIGYGTGNAIPVFKMLFFRSSGDLDIRLLNLGAGVKVFVTEHVALRTEYRFQRYSYEETYNSESFLLTAKSISNFHHLFIGFSVFLH